MSRRLSTLGIISMWDKATDSPATVAVDCTLPSSAVFAVAHLMCSSRCMVVVVDAGGSESRVDVCMPASTMCRINVCSRHRRVCVVDNTLNCIWGLAECPADPASIRFELADRPGSTCYRGESRGNSHVCIVSYSELPHQSSVCMCEAPATNPASDKMRAFDVVPMPGAAGPEIEKTVSVAE